MLFYGGNEAEQFRGRERLIDTIGEACIQERLLVPVSACGHGDDGYRAGVAYIRVAQQGQQIKSVCTRHLNIRQQQVIVPTTHCLYHLFRRGAGFTVDPVAFQHLLYDIQQHRVVIDCQDIQREDGRTRKHRVLVFYVLVGFRQGQCHAECTAVPGLARNGDCSAEQIDKPLGYRQSQPETVGIGCRNEPFKRAEDAGKRLLAHADAGVMDLQEEPPLAVADVEGDRSGFRELDGVGQQVIDDLADTVHVTEKSHVRIVELVAEQDPLVVDDAGETGDGTFQQLVQAERDIVTDFLGLVQAVHVQQVVEQVHDMPADDPDIVQVVVPAFLVAGVHGQLGTAADDVQRGTDVVRDGQNDVLAHFKQRGVLYDRFFQSLPALLLVADVPLYDPVGNGKQDNGA